MRKGMHVEAENMIDYRSARNSVIEGRSGPESLSAKGMADLERIDLVPIKRNFPERS
jgi:hypothetical protein